MQNTQTTEYIKHDNDWHVVLFSDLTAFCIYHFVLFRKIVILAVFLSIFSVVVIDIFDNFKAIIIPYLLITLGHIDRRILRTKLENLLVGTFGRHELFEHTIPIIGAFKEECLKQTVIITIPFTIIDSHVNAVYLFSASHFFLMQKLEELHAFNVHMPILKFRSIY